MEKDKKVRLVAGIINSTGKMFYWKNKIDLVDIGDYVIVENMQGYDLVKVVGIIETTEKEASKFSNTKYENMKKTVVKISKEILTEI